jgi:hypothetical protein
MVPHERLFWAHVLLGRLLMILLLDDDLDDELMECLVECLVLDDMDLWYSMNDLLPVHLHRI